MSEQKEQTFKNWFHTLPKEFNVGSDPLIWGKICYEAGQANAPAPGRWVKCSERLPDSRGYYPYFDGTGIRELWINNETDKDRWGSGQWWEWTYTITLPPAVEQDEDDELVKQLVSEFYLGENFVRKVLSIIRAREKGKQ